MAPKLQERVVAVREIVKLFFLERIVYALATVGAVATLLGAAVMMLVHGKGESAEFLAMFGASGVVTLTTGRVLYMFNRAMSAVWPDPKGE
jgi:hypothetical protein